MKNLIELFHSKETTRNAFHWVNQDQYELGNNLTNTGLIAVGVSIMIAALGQVLCNYSGHCVYWDKNDDQFIDRNAEMKKLMNRWRGKDQGAE